MLNLYVLFLKKYLKINLFMKGIAFINIASSTSNISRKLKWKNNLFNIYVAVNKTLNT